MSSAKHGARPGAADFADAPLAWAEIDLEAVRANYRTIRSLAGSGCEVFAVVKADAYGHGAVQVARVLEREGVAKLCVARVEEAAELRAAGIKSPILVFSPPFEEQAAAALECDAEIAVCSREHIDAVAGAAATSGKRARVHLKIETGMGRLGCRPQGAVALLEKIARAPGVEIAGVMSHFACADMEPRETTERQVNIFCETREAIHAAGINVPCFHTSNSAGVLRFPEARFDAVRSGIALYGQFPSATMKRDVPLVPAMSLKTRIVFVKDVPAGVGLSYGHSFVTKRASRVATVPLGYADGYPRHASNLTHMLVNGQPAAVVGRVCMDLTLLDVTDVRGKVDGNSEVLVWGKGKYGELRAEDVAEMMGTVGYELTTRLGKRVLRRWSN